MTSSKQQQRPLTPLVGDHIGLGQDQTQQGPPLLALRPERPQVAAAVLDGVVVQVRADPGDGTLDVSAAPLTQSRQQMIMVALHPRM